MTSESGAVGSCSGMHGSAFLPPSTGVFKGLKEIGLSFLNAVF